MENLRWSQRGMSFRGLVDNTAMTKPALALIEDKISIVGEKFNGEFILASPCRVTGDRHQMIDREIVLSSRHSGIWKVISKTTSKKEGAIHRLTTKDLENIHRQDLENHRSMPRRYICMKDLEAFELLVRNNDSSVINGQRVDRRIKHLEENAEFEIKEVGETEYTPTEGELTSQDYVTMPRPKSHAFANFWVPDLFARQQKIRNRAVRSLCCATKNGSQERRFLLEVNELPCDIRPIASEGSTELRYLQSTKNLYDYLLSYGNDSVLLVKLVRGDMPMKAIDFDGYMVFRAVLSGDRVPICNVKDLEIKLVSPDISVPVKIPATETPWRSFSEIRAAEVQCMQFTLALLSRHESEVYVTVDYDKGLMRYPTSKSQTEIRTVNFRTSSEPNNKTSDDQRKSSANSVSLHGNYSSSSPSQSESRSKHSRISRRETSKSTKPESSHYQEVTRSSMHTATVHSPSEHLYRNAEKNASNFSSKPNSRYEDVRAVASSRTHQNIQKKSSSTGSKINDSRSQLVGQYKSHASIF